MKNLELKKALFISWGIISVILILVLCCFIFGNANQILSSTPICFSKQQGQTCFLCGSTRAFLEISELNFHKAFKLNKFSLMLFFLFLLNGIYFLYTIYYNLKNKK